MEILRRGVLYISYPCIKKSRPQITNVKTIDVNKSGIPQNIPQNITSSAIFTIVGGRESVTEFYAVPWQPELDRFQPSQIQRPCRHRP